MLNEKCTGTEWDTCRVEKMGCKGCYYDYISKDKIRAKIEELKKINVNGEIFVDVIYAIKTLQELLEEGENDEND